MENTSKKKVVDYSSVNNLNHQYIQNKFSFFVGPNKYNTLIVSVLYAVAGGIAALLLALGFYTVFMFF